MSKRTQPYRLVFPKRYFTQGDDSAGSDELHASKMRKRKKAYEEGRRIDLSKVAQNGMKVSKSRAQQAAIAISKKEKAGEMKKGGKVARKALSASVKKTLQAKARNPKGRVSTHQRDPRRSLKQSRASLLKSGSQRRPMSITLRKREACTYQIRMPLRMT